MYESFYIGLFGSALGGMIAAFAIFFMFVFLAVYIYCAIALMYIARKTHTQNSWLAFIPIANVYLMTQMAGLPGWWTLAVLLPLVPFVGGLAMTVAMVYIWWKIAEKIHRPGWWSILLVIPIVNLVMLGVMAWAKK